MLFFFFWRELSNAVLVHQIFFLREEEAIQLDGLNASQIRELREKSEKFAFQAEVNRMMKLIINSLYKNKEVSSGGYDNVILFLNGS